MQNKALVKTPISTKAVNPTAEAMETRNPIMGFLAVDLKEIHGDLPQLPNRM